MWLSLKVVTRSCQAIQSEATYQHRLVFALSAALVTVRRYRDQFGEAQTETPPRVPRYSPSTCVISALSRRLLGGCKLSNKARQWFSITQVLFRQGGGTQPTAPGAGPPQERQPPGALIVTVCPNFIVLAFSRAIWLSSPAIRRSRHILSHALRA
jgi:hypothetical protein